MALSLFVQLRANLWGVDRRHEPRPFSVEAESDLMAQAADLAAETHAVSVALPQVPQVSGSLLEDVRAITGVTNAQIADVFGVSERAVAEWRDGHVPSHRRQLLQSLLSIGLILVGGLGPAGVRKWLTQGRPARLDLIGRGRLGEVVAEAREFEHSPAT